MSIYGADIAALRSLAQLFDNGAGKLETTRSSVSQQLLTAPWHGPDGAQARGEWQATLAPSLSAASEALRAAARKLVANADAQEQTSTADGGAAAGSGSSGTGGAGSGGSGGTGAGGGGTDSDPAAADDSSDSPGGPTVTVKGPQKFGTDNGAPGSPATEGSGGKVTVGGSYDPDTGETAVSGSGSLEDWFKTSNGSKVSFGVTGGAEITSGEHSEDGYTTYTSKSDVSVGVTGGVSKDGTGVSGSYTTGVTSEYTLKVPDDAHVTDPGSINPYDPSTMPVGSSVTMNSGDYQDTELEAAFRHIATKSDIKESDGVSSVIEKTGDDTVRITAGPTDAISNYGGVGLDFDVIKVMLGNKTDLGSASLQSAELDLSTPEGLAAYNTYLATGVIPEYPSTGISGVTTIERIDYSSGTKLDIDTPVGGLSFDGAENSGSTVQTTYPDGSSDRLTTLSYDGRGDTTVTQAYDTSGAEVPGDRTYTFNVTADQMTTQLFNQGDFSGFDTSGTVQEGQTVQISLTQNQMADLLHNAQDASSANDMAMQLRTVTEVYGDKITDPFEFAKSLASVPRSDGALVDLLWQINSGSDGDWDNGSPTTFPGTVTPTK